METVAIVDCGSGNLRSAAKAFERAAREAGRDVSVTVTADPDAVRRADRVALPGQGAFAAVLAGVAEVPGLREALEEVAIAKARPFLGICVGMQLMATRGLEHGSRAGFGWIPGEVVPLEPGRLKVPHMGWNDLALDRPDHPMMRAVRSGDHAYFVHSYQYRCDDAADLVAHADYGGPVTAVICRDNLIGTQFHPEKSQSVGLALITAFLDWDPEERGPEMRQIASSLPPPRIVIQAVERLKGGDLNDLCEAAELAIRADGGFGWLNPPARDVMERYWRGVMTVPERTLFVGRLDGVIGGSIQMVRPPRNNEAQAMAVQAMTAFMAPWARGHGMTGGLIEAVEVRALEEGFAIVNIDVRETQSRAIALCETMGYTLWGAHPAYARVDGKYVPGRFYFKDLTST